MTDNELEMQLKKGRQESGAFFAHTDTDALRKVTLRKAGNGEKAGKRRPFKLRAGLAAALAAVFALVLGGIIMQIISFSAPKAAVTGGSVAEQPVSLGKNNANYMVSFFPVNQPYEKEPGLMSVLWEMRSDKTPSMVYSSLFEKCDEPYPASTAGFPGTDAGILLISSGDKYGNYLHYRLIGFDSGALTTLRSQDFVRQGKLDVLNGIVVEKRLIVDADKGSGTITMLVSYIIPCEEDENGELFLPVSNLKLRMGEQILLVGANTGDALEAVSEKGLMLGSGEGGGASDSNSLVFHPRAKGTDVLSIKKGGGMKYLAVNIGE